MSDFTTRIDHTAKAFDADLQEITRKVAEMGGLAEQQIADATLALADRVYVLEKGAVRFSGDAAELRCDKILLDRLLSL